MSEHLVIPRTIHQLQLPQDDNHLWDLVNRYDAKGPRYTSYPTAVSFHEQVTPDDVETAWRNSTRDISLYLHLPFCFQLCWYCGCHMKVERKREPMARYLDALQKEAEGYRALFAGKRIRQFHLGGGTPNQFPKELLLDLIGALQTMFDFDDDAERSIEVDPRLLNQEQLEAFARLGFERLSMGIQDFNPRVQAAINRHQTYEQVKAQVDLWRQMGQGGVNMDLIYGLPLQSVDSFNQTVEQVINLEPQRIALFNFAHIPQRMRHQRLIRSADLPEPITKFKILLNAVRRFTEAGYVPIGMDHFAKPDDPLAKSMLAGDLHRNFQGYTTLPDLDMLGLGASSISMLDGFYGQNLKGIDTYQERINAKEPVLERGLVLSEEDRFRRDIIQNWMCRFVIEVGNIERDSGVSFENLFPGIREKLAVMVEDGLLETHEFGYQATALGMLLARNVAMLFDGRLASTTPGQFSRTI
ncbi:oxygen-independent coproporphyrinogen III oxidase [Acanthopleuribacter pedis]|uniref:Coproporphyrinogen-III oxidase n=1 Tax=Acanthopleuribacter pedis TaxID=442870 RepID=A0A8J7QDT8_9BACT|nr:oxygen-independent coproporphyrinogen III oxidase [Acanthopleuribacter pedis]MBO1322722.1 oxygen-independent coproporphyrinogen III oxidase [Acanthopleuribacter pedis]